MNRVVRGLTWALLPSMIVVAGLTTAIRSDSPISDLRLSDQVCRQPPEFTLGGEREPGGLVEEGEGYRMTGMSWVRADLCTAGTLTVTADGQGAQGEEPQLDVSLNGRVIASEQFGSRRTVQIRVPQTGVLTLAYVNDLFLADVRLATLAQPRISGGRCTRINEVRTPLESAAGWDSASQSGTVLRGSPPMVMVPCGAGVLSVAIKGQAAAGEFPTLVFRQGGEVLRRVQTGKTFTRTQMLVGAGPIEVTVDNPYAALRADRNLNLRMVEFSAD